jgi:hypothetical protein
VLTLSGFSATVANARQPGDLVGLVRSFLVQGKDNNLVFARLVLSAELAVGLTVGDSEQFVARLEFSPSELLLCA